MTVFLLGSKGTAGNPNRPQCYLSINNDAGKAAVFLAMLNLVNVGGYPPYFRLTSAVKG